jgi:hypothetical protein
MRVDLASTQQREPGIAQASPLVQASRFAKLVGQIDPRQNLSSY